MTRRTFFAALLPGRFEAIERRIGGRLGVAVLDTGSGLRMEYRGQERFPMCSTFKFLAAAAVLRRVDEGRENLDRVVAYGAADLLEYAPVTREHVAQGGLPMSALCAAVIELSDNTAANLILRSLGGPAELTRLIRTLGDRMTRLDRMEPDLNSAIPGDPRDTTTPHAMVGSMRQILLAGALSAASKAKLEKWLAGCTTGAARLRAGVPAGWSVGDKTGTGSNAATNDIAILRAPGKPPILVAAYSVGSNASTDEKNAALAEVGRIASSAGR